MKIRVSYFERKLRKERVHINKIINERGDITINTTRVTKDYVCSVT